MIKSNYIVFDCETGGLDEKKNPITQYAAIVLDGKTLKEIDRFETFIKPYHDLIIEKEALEHTMVKMSDINSGLSVKEFVDTVTIWWDNNRARVKNKEMGRLVPVGHNVIFDINFVNYALQYVKNKDMFEWIYPNFVDTFVLGKMAFGIKEDEKLNLNACCEKARIHLTDAHGAMNDVEATTSLFRWYVKKLRGKENNVVEEVERARGQDFFEFKCGVK